MPSEKLTTRLAISAMSGVFFVLFGATGLSILAVEPQWDSFAHRAASLALVGGGIVMCSFAAVFLVGVVAALLAPAAGEPSTAARAALKEPSNAER